MRIGQMVASYQQQAMRQVQSGTGTGASAALAGAQRANQARLTDAGKGVVQASKVRDGVAAVAGAADKARSLVEKAKDTSLSAADRKQLQADFAKALAAADQGGKDQATALADKTLANDTYSSKRTTVSADRLGQGVSSQFSSIADLKKLDLSTASADQLAEAAKVLDTGRTEAKSAQASADQQVQRATGRAGQFQAVQDALGGTALSSRQQRDLQAIQALIAPGGASTGTLFSGLV